MGNSYSSSSIDIIHTIQEIFEENNNNTENENQTNNKTFKNNNYNKGKNKKL